MIRENVEDVQEGDTVLDPFSGVGSTVYCAVKMGRKGVGIELKKTYYRQAKRNLESLKTNRRNVKEFDL